MLLLKTHHQAQVTAFHLHLSFSGQSSIDWLFQAALEHRKMADASYLIQYCSHQTHFWVKAGKTHLHGSGAARHAVHINDQEGRNVQDLGHLCSAAHIRPIHAVVEPHYTLNHSHVCSFKSGAEGATHAILAHHKGVKIERRAAANSRVVGWVDEVRADLEGLDLQATLSQRCHEAQGNCGLADAAVGASNEHSRDLRQRIRRAHKMSFLRQGY